MKHFIVIAVLLSSFSYGAITLKTVVFNDYEENSSTYLVKYYPYQHFINMQLTATQAGYIMTCRNNNTPTLTCGSTAGLTTANLMRIRESSYLIDWSLVTNSLGINQRDYWFLMGLLGSLIGFVIALFLVYGVMNISRGLK